MKNTLKDRFFKYIAIDTQSDPNSETTPSTQKQFNLANELKTELEELGLQEVKLDNNCYLTALLPSNTTKDVPVIGFLSHMDTAPDCSGQNVKPQIIENYQGGDVRLNKDTVISADYFPSLNNYIGKTLITTSGDTLLGSDDKAGIAEIITAIEYLINNPEIKHGDIRIGFTPDEEIGQGADHFKVKQFGAEYAYTLDGGEVGELEYENFNAAGVKICIHGIEVHPGYSKDKMINAVSVATEIEQGLPYQKPSNTSGYEGFFHLMEINGCIKEANMQYIIRDHDREKFEHKKVLMEQVVKTVENKYPGITIDLEIKDQYYNMKEMVEPHIHIIDIAEEAMIRVGITPKIKAIRGGTDGARLSFMGLPCPNVFAGGENFHSRFEYVPLESMVGACETIIEIVKLFEEKAK